jgi:hypothetical protein
LTLGHEIGGGDGEASAACSLRAASAFHRKVIGIIVGEPLQLRLT